jgi:Fic family protein
MKIPMPPPTLSDLMDKFGSNGQEHLIQLLVRATLERAPVDPYIPWHKLRYKTPPEGLTHEEWWLMTKVRRQTLQRELPLLDKDGKPFTFALTDSVLVAIEEVNRHLSGHIGIAEQVTNPANRDRYLVNSLMEEAITSSQLEGASTTRAVAKEMIRSGRPPANRDERMILNNYALMRQVSELKTEPVTVDLLMEIQRIATEGTLDNPDAAGRFQRPGEVRVGVYDNYNNLLHTPPPADSLDERAARLCAFANGQAAERGYVPPVIRAIISHFMMGYDHPFEDGNGRTARGLFYWIMLRQEYWLTEFISISRILRGAPSKYAHSYLYSEQDDNDLTYFILYQLQVIQRAIKDLHTYLNRKVQEVREFQRSVATMPGEFNHRQIALLQNALRRADAYYTVQSHGNSHGIVRQTARQDLLDLERRGLLDRQIVGRKFVWRPAADLLERLNKP